MVETSAVTAAFHARRASSAEGERKVGGAEGRVAVAGAGQDVEPGVRDGRSASRRPLSRTTIWSASPYTRSTGDRMSSRAMSQSPCQDWLSRTCPSGREVARRMSARKVVDVLGVVPEEHLVGGGTCARNPSASRPPKRVATARRPRRPARRASWAGAARRATGGDHDPSDAVRRHRRLGQRVGASARQSPDAEALDAQLVGERADLLGHRGEPGRGRGRRAVPRPGHREEPNPVPARRAGHDRGRAARPWGAVLEDDRVPGRVAVLRRARARAPERRAATSAPPRPPHHRRGAPARRRR